MRFWNWIYLHFLSLVLFTGIYTRFAIHGASAILSIPILRIDSETCACLSTLVCALQHLAPSPLGKLPTLKQMACLSHWRCGAAAYCDIFNGEMGKATDPWFGDNGDENPKNCLKAVFDSSKEALWYTECNSKNPSSLQVTVSEKIGNNLKNYNFLPNLPKIVIFGGKPWFFQKPYFVKNWAVLCCIQCIRTLLLTYQKQLSEKYEIFSCPEQL